MKALTFTLSWPRLAAAKLLGAFSPAGFLSPLGPVRLADVPEPELPGPDWVRVETRRAGICGSDLKQVFLEGAIDNPLTSFITFPHVMGHEVAGVVELAGVEADLAVGDRVVVFPWLTCEPRGLPLCPACQAGRLPSCQSLDGGRFAPGMHYGTCRDVGGGFAERFVAHRSMCFRIPDGIGFDAAVLADPFAVCLRALLKAPPVAGERVVVLGCGALGAMLVHLIARLYPGVRIWAVDRAPELRELGMALGAELFISAGGRELVETVAERLGVRLYEPWRGLPWLLDGVDRIYDLVGAPSTIEAGIRILEPGGTLTVVGVSKPARFEWTPLYFKEISVLGSNGCGIEDFEGSRQHAFAIYLELLASGRVDPTSLVTHHFPLGAYRRAFEVARDKRAHRSIKVVFDFEGSKQPAIGSGAAEAQ